MCALGEAEKREGLREGLRVGLEWDSSGTQDPSKAGLFRLPEGLPLRAVLCSPK